jgi:hypothetical protein
MSGPNTNLVRLNTLTKKFEELEEQFQGYKAAADKKLVLLRTRLALEEARTSELTERVEFLERELGVTLEVPDEAVSMRSGTAGPTDASGPSEPEDGEGGGGGGGGDDDDDAVHVVAGPSRASKSSKVPKPLKVRLLKLFGDCRQSTHFHLFHLMRLCRT